MIIENWAQKWGIPQEAINDLKQTLNAHSTPTTKKGPSEASAQQKIVLKASYAGSRLWRNNCGATMDEKTNRLIRYGLANESKEMNSKIKSSDLIGITPVVITQGYVGHTIGVFTSVEVKKPGWKFAGTKRENAQLNWLNLVVNLGGYAQFATGPEDLNYAVS